MSSVSPHNRTAPYFTPPPWLAPAAGVSIAVGLAGMAAGFALAPRDTWLWLIVFFLIFSGIVDAMLAWAAAFRVAQARWTPAINRLAHSALAFVPILGVVLIILVVGVGQWASWVHHPVHGKTGWYNVPFMAARDIVGMGILWTLYYVMVRWSLLLDEKVSHGGQLTEADHHKLNAISVAAVMIFPFVSTLVSYDFIMALEPEWISTMFGPYYFCTNLYAALAVLVLIAAALRKPLGVEDYTKPQQFKDIGNLMLAFSLFNMGLFFAQYLTIWYENLPEEVRFLIVRYLRGAWPPVAWCSLILAYSVPFLLLQGRRIKERYRLLSPVAVVGLIGFAMERYVMVVPSIQQARLMIFPVGVLGIFAFLGAFVLSITAFLRRYPPVSSAQEALREIETREPV